MKKFLLAALLFGASHAYALNQIATMYSLTQTVGTAQSYTAGVSIISISATAGLQRNSSNWVPVSIMLTAKTGGTNPGFYFDYLSLSYTPTTWTNTLTGSWPVNKSLILSNVDPSGTLIIQSSDTGSANWAINIFGVSK